MKRVCAVLWALCVFGPATVALGGGGGQTFDPDYDPEIAEPTYGGTEHPVVGVDSTHANYHTINPPVQRYRGFKLLAEADGYVVQDFNTAFTSACTPSTTCAFKTALSQLDTLVIANAQAPVTIQEALLIANWVAFEGGKLILIADHRFNGTAPDFPVMTQPLAQLLGIDWKNSNIQQITFTKANGEIAEHPTTQGFDTPEDIPEVTTFTGSVFDVFSVVPASPILYVPNGLTWTDDDQVAHSADGLLQGLTIEFGAGRVYASGEAAMFTAQQFGTTKFGMQVTPYNEQFLLNVLHWLDGLL
jgi:hypothetical protein